MVINLFLGFFVPLSYPESLEFVQYRQVICVVYYETYITQITWLYLLGLYPGLLFSTSTFVSYVQCQVGYWFATGNMYFVADKNFLNEGSCRKQGNV